MSSFPVLISVILLVLAKSSLLIFATAEWELSCDSANSIVSDKLTKQIQGDCHKELNITPENATCVVQCLFQKYNMTDMDGMPNKEKFDKYCDEKVDTKIRDQLKTNMTCFTDHVSKIKPNDTMCMSSMDFDNCFNDYVNKVCKM